MVRRPITILRDLLLRSIKFHPIPRCKWTTLALSPVGYTNAEQGAILCFKKGGGGSSPHNHLSWPDLLLPTGKFHPIPRCCGLLLLHLPSMILKNAEQGAIRCFKKVGGGSSPDNHLSRPDL